MKNIDEYNSKTPFLDKAFREYIKGKRVVVVGRSGIHEMKQGAFIDSHDIVVRVHGNVPYVPNQSLQSNWDAEYNYFKGSAEQYMPEEWHEIVGKRVNVLYFKLRHKTFVNDHDGFIKGWLKALKQSGLKFLCRDVMTNQQQYENAHIRNHALVRYPSRELLDWIASQIEELVEAGSLAITDILLQKPKSVHVTGFPCDFANKLFPGLPKWKNHQLNNFKDLCHLHEQGHITCDDTMKKLFDMMFYHRSQRCGL